MSEDLLQQILYKLGTVKGKVDTIESKVYAIEDKVGLIEDKIDLIEDRVGSIEGKVGAIEVRVDSIEGNMATKQDISRIEKNLDATFEQVAKSAETITNIAGSQERHERILEILSKRSIEQEAYIRRSC